MDYSFDHFEIADLVKLDILINSDKVDALASIIHRDHAQSAGREVAERLQKIIPRQMYDIALQAAIGAKIIARTTIKALRKMSLQNVMVVIFHVRKIIREAKGG